MSSFSFYLKIGLQTLALLSLSGCEKSPDPIQRPNILLILVDDLGNNDIASWGDDQAPTPSLNKLSQESIRFRRHYTDSTCSPSRASLLTGQHSVNVGFQANGLGLSSDQPTLPKSLKSLGYYTAHLGKWHVGEALEYPEIQPGNQGFDYWMGFLNHYVLRGPGPDGQILQQVPTHINPWLQENGHPPVQHPGYLDDLLTDKAVELISKTDKQPWYINLWLFSPHTPYQPAPEFKAQFPDTPDGRYLAVLKQLDHNVARLMSTLREKGLEENTIVVFASDNGGNNKARNNNFPLLGKKATYLEGGVRSPLVIRWPSRYKSNDVLNVTHITDLFPTLVKLAGGQVPAGLMGRNLEPLLRGESLPNRSSLYWAADIGNTEITYAGVNFLENRAFYQDTNGILGTYLVTSAIDTLRPTEKPPQTFTAQQASTEITEWERQARRVHLVMHPASADKPAFLSGMDFQRAPVFGGYSLGMSLSRPNSGKGEQTLVEQKGIWKISLEADHRLKLQHQDTELYSSPIKLTDRCNTLVASFYIQQTKTYPYEYKANSHVELYLNGASVLDSRQILSRPKTAQPLTNPTFIGANGDGTNTYRGKIGKPVLINKKLIPRQDGYNLADMLSELCKTSK